MLKKIARLRKLSVFDDFQHDASLPMLARYNLVYGFNGSGKTTLSRMLRHVELGILPPEWPTDAEFSLELASGHVMSSTGPLDGLKNRLLVFNVDFVDEHLNWKDGKASSIFYIGRAQAELANELRLKEDTIVKIGIQLDAARRTANAQQQRLATFKRDTARLIASELNLNRAYIATHLEADYAARTPDAADILTEAQLQEAKSVLSQSAPRPKLEPLPPTAIDLSELATEAGTVLPATVGAIALDELRAHPTMLSWIRAGVDYHGAYALDSCLFCGNPLDDRRLEALRRAVDDRFDRLVRNIADLQGRISAVTEALQRLNAALPTSGALSPGLDTGFDQVRSEFQSRLARVESTIASLGSTLDQKASSPNTSISVPRGFLPDVFEAIGRDLLDSVSDIAKIIARHNKRHDEFEETRGDARARLKRHHLAERYGDYKDATGASTAADSEQSDLAKQQGELRGSLVELRQRIREHGPAAAELTKGIRGYLGHDHLEIRALEEGYQIVRRGVPVQGCLSEGEKTAIALVYFLSRLTAEGRKLSDLIVVIDDPVSSLDSRALNYAFNLLRNSLRGVAQVIVLTHNLAFMNELKKWLREKVKDGDAAWFMVDCKEDNAGGRISTIVELPKLLQEHESEYHYLFNLMHDFAQDASAHNPYLYLMPNALRKVLEIFLTFKFPGQKNLANMVQHVADGGAEELDPARLRAVERLIQVESHGDNIDDLVAMSSMTIEETRDAASATLSMMKVLDKKHYDGMIKLCT